MREKNRNSIENIKKLPQFTTMNVIDGQAGLVSYSSLIFYSLTIDNILNIVVLLILAAVTISVLTGNNGILNRAIEAKEKNLEKTLQEEVTLASLAAKSKGLGTATQSDLNVELNKINRAKVKYDEETNTFSVSRDGYTFKVTPDGVVTKKEGWEYIYSDDGIPIQVINGNIKIDIGDVINYDATTIEDNEAIEELAKATDITVQQNEDGKTYSISYTSKMGFQQNESTSIPSSIGSGNGHWDKTFSNSITNDGNEVKWKLLGIDEETGNLLITTSTALKTIDSGFFYLRGYTGFYNGIDELNKICKIYGYGYGADTSISARCITLEDINNLTGYVSSSENDSYTFNRNDSGSVVAYKNGTEYATLSDSTYWCGFNYFLLDSNLQITSWGSSKQTNNIELPGDNNDESITINYRPYKPNEYVTNVKIKDLLYDTNQIGYWLASVCTRLVYERVFFLLDMGALCYA